MDEAHLAWKSAPSVRDLARQFPRAARLEQVRRGSVKVHCTARGNGTLACVPAEQSPDGLGFGPAAVTVLQRARVKSTDGSSPEGRRFVYGVKFGDWPRTAPAQL